MYFYVLKEWWSSFYDDWGEIDDEKRPRYFKEFENALVIMNERIDELKNEGCTIIEDSDSEELAFTRFVVLRNEKEHTEYGLEVCFEEFEDYAE